MTETTKQHCIYPFDPVRPELVTDPNACTEDDERIAEAHWKHLVRATLHPFRAALVRPPSPRSSA